MMHRLWIYTAASEWCSGHVLLSVLMFATAFGWNGDCIVAGVPARGASRDFDQVEKAVVQEFCRKRGRMTADVVSQSDIAIIFELLTAHGIRGDESVRAQVAVRVLPDHDDMVRQLRSFKGTPFMRKIASYPYGYDRLDRLRRMPHGRRRLREFIRGPDGHLMIAYMTTTRGGANLGMLLSRAPAGRKFNRPTGRLYTAKDVVAYVMKIRAK